MSTLVNRVVVGRIFSGGQETIGFIATPAGASRPIVLKNSARSLAVELATHESAILQSFLHAVGFHATCARTKSHWRHVQSALSSFSE
jgi:hypothetical protein